MVRFCACLESDLDAHLVQENTPALKSMDEKRVGKPVEMSMDEKLVAKPVEMSMQEKCAQRLPILSMVNWPTKTVGNSVRESRAKFTNTRPARFTAFSWGWSKRGQQMSFSVSQFLKLFSGSQSTPQNINCSINQHCFNVCNTS